MKEGVVDGIKLWTVEKVPIDVIKSAVVSGNMDIPGISVDGPEDDPDAYADEEYACVVFEAPDGTRWAQKKNPPVSVAAVASRIASRP